MAETLPPIFLVSLEQDKTKRDNLALRFPGHFAHMEWIRAVNGNELPAKEFCEYVTPGLAVGQRLLLPGEVGCSLSHLKALRSFLDSNHQRAIILEDDIIGNDADIASIIGLISEQPENSLMILGGQEGLPARKYIFGKPTALSGVYRLPEYSNSHIFRTCCYSVTRTSAKQIVDAQTQRLGLADAWDRFFRNTDTYILYTRKLEHPEELGNSTIEEDRAKLSHRSRLRQPFMFFIKRRLSRIKRKIGALVCLLNGYKRVGR